MDHHYVARSHSSNHFRLLHGVSIKQMEYSMDDIENGNDYRALGVSFNQSHALQTLAAKRDKLDLRSVENVE